MSRIMSGLHEKPSSSYDEKHSIKEYENAPLDGLKVVDGLTNAQRVEDAPNGKHIVVAINQYVMINTSL